MKTENQQTSNLLESLGMTKLQDTSKEQSIGSTVDISVTRKKTQTKQAHPTLKSKTISEPVFKETNNRDVSESINDNSSHHTPIAVAAVVDNDGNSTDKSTKKAKVEKKDELNQGIDVLKERSIHLADNLAGSAYRAIRNSSGEKKNKKRKTLFKHKYKQEHSQSIIPVQWIRYGIIKTTTNKYIKIIEVLPCDFYAQSIHDQDTIASIFGRMFDQCPVKMHLKIIVDTNNPQKIIDFVKRKCEEENYQRGIKPETIVCAEDHINKIRGISNSNTLTKRYFIIYEYEGKSSDINEIYYDMQVTKNYIVSSLAEMRCSAVEYDSINEENIALADILYYHFNRQTYRSETLESRIKRITRDGDIYNSLSAEDDKSIYDADFLAPKGAKFVLDNYIEMDGIYKTFLVIKSSSHPYYAQAGWLDPIMSCCNGTGCEIDVYTRRLSKPIIMPIIDNKFYIDNAMPKKFGNAEVDQYILERLKNGEELYDVVIIITLLSDTLKGLYYAQRNTIKALKGLRSKVYCEDAYQYCWQYYIATMPLMELPPSIMFKHKRNYLTSSLMSLFHYTSAEYTDPKGVVFGTNYRNGSLLTINLANKSMIPNMNMFVCGGSGEGKTFTLNIIARAFRLHGNRVISILPVKGYEYKEGCEAIGGSYIVLAPGSKDCINLMEIRPEQTIDKSMLVDDSAVANVSLLAKKITFLVTWLQLLDRKRDFTSEEESIISSALFELYRQFGITEDNDSIFLDDGSLKPMPIIQDMYNAFLQYGKLESINSLLLDYISGPFKNLNGQTNVDLDNKYIVFDVDGNNMPEKYLAPCMNIAIDISYGLVKQNRFTEDMIIIDEFWKAMTTEKAAKQLQDMVKLIRGYGGGVIFSTQEFSDALGNPYGVSIINNTSTKILLRCQPTDMEKIEKHVRLSEDEVSRILSFPVKQGYCFIIAGNNRIFGQIKPSEKEKAEFDTEKRLS